MHQQSSRTPEGFEFRGSAREWFGIWIVNLLLTIVTLGIYSAWAKVRTRKYFYQNTYVAGRNFDYHATGMQILIGRLIVIAGFIAFSLVSAIPLFGLFALLGLLIIVPWLLVRAFRFNAAVTSWSNVRFRFSGGYGGAFMTYIVVPFLVALTLYLTFPFLDRARKRFVMNFHSLGNHDFAFDAGIGGFYKAFFVSALWVLGVSMVVVALTFPGFEALNFAIESEDPTVFLPMMVGIYVWFFVALVPAATIHTAMVRNLTISNLTLEGGHAFHSNIVPGVLVWITISNAVLSLLSLGLLLPWAKVRMTRYLANHTTLLPGPSLDNFVGQMEAEASAIGDAYSDIEGFEVGLPV